MVQVLLKAGANVECVDSNGRTPLMMAAYRGHVAALEALTSEPKCSVFTEDAHGNTALHHAARLVTSRHPLDRPPSHISEKETPLLVLARGNQAPAVGVLANLISTRMYQIVYGSTKMDGKTFNDLVRQTFEHFQVSAAVPDPFVQEKARHVAVTSVRQDVRCTKHETQRFLKDWITDAATHVYEKLMPANVRLILKLPPKHLILAVVAQYDPDPNCGRWVKNQDDRYDWEPNVSVPEDLAVVLCKAFKVGEETRLAASPPSRGCDQHSFLSRMRVLTAETTWAARLFTSPATRTSPTATSKSSR